MKPLTVKTDLIEDSVRTLYQEARRRAVYEGVSSYDEYRDLVEELLLERVNDGVFGVSEDIPTMQRDLEMLWPEVERALW